MPASRFDDDDEFAPALRLVALVFRPGRLGAIAVAVSLAGVAPTLLASMTDGREIDDFRVGPADLRVTAKPTPDSLEGLLGRVFTRIGVAYRTDEDLATRVAEAFKVDPVVLWVREVKPLPDGRIEARVHCRTTRAVFATDAGGVPVAEDKTVLPAQDLTPNRVAELPIVRNVATEPPQPGHRWEDGAVNAALDIAVALRADWADLGFTTIDVGPADADGRRQFALVGPGRTALWGSAPDAELDDEPDVRAKVARLAERGDAAGHCDLSRSPPVVAARPDLWPALRR